MDPNKALTDIRNVIHEFSIYGVDDGFMLQSLIENFEALDGWLKTGGFLPSEWDKRRALP